MNHWIVAPVLLPLVAGLVLLLVAHRGLAVQRPLAIGAGLAGVGLGAVLVGMADAGAPQTYALGGWPPPFGIVLVLDRLSALMVLLTAVVALFSLLYAVRGPDHDGAHYHPLFQLQLVGLNGAFLTGDLFNLFVFFEILLIASYCLLLHGAGRERLRAGVHYVVLNLAGSALFLIGVGALYGITGTLNMADMAQRVAELGAADAGLVRSAGLLLLVVFGLKAAIVPLYFWLPSAYSAASAPVAALFAIMTKVGVYAIVRVYTLIFGPEAGVAANLAGPWLLPIALVTVVLASLGALAARELRRMQGYLLIASVGVMLGAIALARADAIAAGLYYMVHSTVAMAAMFLLADLVGRSRGERDDLLVGRGPVIPSATLAVLFFTGAVAAVGLPPLSGFLGKTLILDAALETDGAAWVWSIVLASSFVALLGLGRAGALLFWDVDGNATAGPADPPRAADLAPAAGLLAVILFLTVAAGPVTDFVRNTAGDLLGREPYVGAVLGGGR
jgi:multicomponent K+:H+ antiporter subunit D